MEDKEFNMEVVRQLETVNMELSETLDSIDTVFYSILRNAKNIKETGCSDWSPGDLGALSYCINRLKKFEGDKVNFILEVLELFDKDEIWLKYPETWDQEDQELIKTNQEFFKTIKELRQRIKELEDKPKSNMIEDHDMKFYSVEDFLWKPNLIKSTDLKLMIKYVCQHPKPRSLLKIEYIYRDWKTLKGDQFETLQGIDIYFKDGSSLWIEYNNVGHGLSEYILNLEVEDGGTIDPDSIIYQGNID